MSQEPPAKRLRKGTSSCLECRQRKVKCIWPTDQPNCDACRSRNQTCHLQTEAISVTEAAKSTSKSRIEHLENSVSSLWSTVRALEAKLGSEPTTIPQQYHPSPSSERRGVSEDPERYGHSAASVHYDSSEKPRVDDSTSLLSPANPPSHLLQLFDNGIIGSLEQRPLSSQKTPSRTQTQNQGALILRNLLPSREDMISIVSHAASWLHLYNALFPMRNVMSSGEELLRQYEKVQRPDSDVTEIASLLIAVAITAHQEPQAMSYRAGSSIEDAPTFVREVSDNVERIIISDNATAGTLEGIETCLLFLRLQLGRGDVRNMWLLSRRIIGLAELLGLHRASNSEFSNSDTTSTDSLQQIEYANSRRRQAEVWESLCAIDRISSMMWSLPLATTNFPLPKLSLVDSQGRIVPQAIMYRLAETARKILDMENMYFSSKPRTELFNAVMSTDQELRSLASQIPKNWWRSEWTSLCADMVLQYWHSYVLARTHLQLALTYDGNEQYNFNFLTCLDACKALTKRYAVLRPLLPAGFFANRIIDLQAFTGAIFLLLASHRNTSSGVPHGDDSESISYLWEQTVRIMESVSHRRGGDVARQAAESVRSLSDLLRDSRSTNPQKITLNLPLVGRINVSRKPTVNPTSTSEISSSDQAPSRNIYPTFNGGSHLTPQESPMNPSDYDVMDSLQFSMDMPEAYPFLTEAPFENEQWLWTS